MKILLTGATGYIGSVIAERLHAAGHEVLALARSDAAAARLADLKYTPVRGDITDAAGLAALARQADGLIHAATTNDDRNAPADAALVPAVLDAYAGTGKPFVYTSGVWSLPDLGEAIADETTPASPLPLVAFRIASEDAVLAAKARGVRGIVLRPAIAYGRAGGIPALFVKDARTLGHARVVGDGRQEWPLVHVEDLADLYVAAVESAPAGSLLHATSGPSYAVRDIATAASLAAGAGGKVRPWPLEDARASYGGFADALALHQRVSSQRTQKLLGWTPTRASILQDLLVGSYRTPA